MGIIADKLRNRTTSVSDAYKEMNDAWHEAEDSGATSDNGGGKKSPSSSILDDVKSVVSNIFSSIGEHYNNNARQTWESMKDEDGNVTADTVSQYDGSGDSSNAYGNSDYESSDNPFVQALNNPSYDERNTEGNGTFGGNLRRDVNDWGNAVAADASAVYNSGGEDGKWKLYEDAIANPAMKIAATPIIPGQARVAAGLVAAPDFISGLVNSGQQGYGDNGDGGFIGALKEIGNSLVAQPLGQLAQAATNPSETINSIREHPGNLWNNVLEPAMVAEMGARGGKKIYDNRNAIKDFSPMTDFDKQLSDLEENTYSAPDAAEPIRENEPQEAYTEQTADAAPEEAQPEAPQQQAGGVDTGIDSGIDSMVNDAAARNGIDPALLAKVIYQESTYGRDPNAGGNLAQVSDDLAAHYGLDNSDPAQSIEAGARYLKEQLDANGGDAREALAAYNAGPGNKQAGYGYADSVLGRDIGGDIGQSGGGSAGGAYEQGAESWMGARMPSGSEGCVEAATRVGSFYDPFLKEEADRGVASVPRLVEDAGDRVIPFDESRLEKGDIIVYGDNDHVVTYDGNGGYVGNSTSQGKIVHGSDYHEMGDMSPTKIIKTSDHTGGGNYTAPGNDSYSDSITQEESGRAAANDENVDILGNKLNDSDVPIEEQMRQDAQESIDKQIPDINKPADVKWDSSEEKNLPDKEETRQTVDNIINDDYGKPETKEPWQMTRDEYNKSIMESDTSAYAPTETTVDWGEPGSVKRVGGMVYGNPTIRGKVTRENILGNLPEVKNQDAISDILPLLDVGQKEAYLHARSAGMEPKEAYKFAKADEMPQIDPHMNAVKEALADGRDVPKEVLKDYPDLAREAGNNVREYSKAEEQLSRLGTDKLIKRGQDAVKYSIQSKKDIPNAMYRNDVGSIDLKWGKEGDPTKDYKGGFGMSHILAKYGDDAAKALPDVVMNGKVVKQGIYKTTIEHGDFVAILSRNFNGKETSPWVVTNFDKTKEPVSARREGNNSSTPTAHTPTSTRRMRDTGSSTSNIPPEENKFNNELFSSDLHSNNGTEKEIASEPYHRKGPSRFIEEEPEKRGFLSNDVKPAAKSLIDFAKNAKKEVQEIIAPSTISESSKLTSQNMREFLSDMAHKGDTLEKSMGPIWKHFDKNPEESLSFIHAMEHGEKISDPKLQGFADTMRKIMDDRAQEVRDLGTGQLQHFIKNYFPHIWKDEKSANSFAAAWLGKRPFEGKKSFLKQRTIPTIEEGIKAGLTPISKNPVDLVIMKMREMDKYIMAHKTMNAEHEAGRGKWIKDVQGEEAPEGWKKVDDKIAVKYGPPTVGVKEAYDPAIMESLNHVCDVLGIKHSRETNLKIEGRNASSDTWGYASKSGKIGTKFGGPESVLAHEIGHQLDYKYHIYDIMRGDRRNFRIGKSNRYTTAGEEMKREFEILADKRMDPNDMSDSRRNYVQGGTEPMAAVIEAYVHAPDILKESAPLIYKNLMKFFDVHPELNALRDIKPSLRLKENTGEQRVNGLVTLAHFYMPEESARLINNYLAPGLRDKSSIFRAYLGAANVMNQYQLGLSAFHLGFTSMDSIVSKTALSVIKASRGDIFSAVTNLLHAPIAPIENAMRGDKLYKEWMKPGSQGAEEGKLLDALIAGGGRVKMDKMYQTDMIQTMRTAFRQGNYVGAAARVPFALMEMSVKPILEYVVPRQKLGIFADLMHYEMKRNPNMTHEQLQDISGRIWNSTDNRLGQLCYDNLFWKKTLKDVLMASTRSVGWNLGTWRELGGAVVDTGKYAGKALKERSLSNGKTGGITYRMSYAIALPVTVGMFGAIMQYMYTGEGPNDMKDLFYPRTGTLDQKGRPQRIELPSYMKDLAAYYEHPGRTLENKLHPMLSAIADMIHNKDYYGKEIYHKDDDMAKKAMDVMYYVAQQFVPFSVRGSKYNADLGGSLLSKALPFFGITPAPADVNKTEVEKKMSEIMEGKRQAGSRTQAQADKADLRSTILRDLQASNGMDKTSLNNAYTNKQIDKAEKTRLLNEYKLTPLQRQASTLDPEEIQSLMKDATSDEKPVLDKIYQRKIQNKKKRQ